MNRLQAIQAVAVKSNNTFDVYFLSGPRNATLRAEIMTGLTGVKTPKSKAGVNAIWKALCSIYTPDGDCLARRENDYAAWALQAIELDTI